MAWAFAALLLSLCAHSAQQTLPLAPPDEHCVSSCGSTASPPHGRCLPRTPAAAPRCECLDAFGGAAADCSERLCPSAPAWWDAPLSATLAHTHVVECSGVGACDRAAGTCQCTAGYEGEACQRTSCPGTSQGMPCSGNGRCMTMAAAAAAAPYGVAYAAWEAQRLQGCVCDEGWGGAACETRACPTGPSATAGLSAPLGADGQPAAGLLVETQVITSGTGARAAPEVQALYFGASGSGGMGSGGGADIDEVQQLTLAGHGGLWPSGNFTVTLDARPGSGGCRLWPDAARVLASTAVLTLEEREDKDVVGERLRQALGALPSIGGAANLRVSAALLPAEDPDFWAGYTWQVTFVGAGVGGDVTALGLDASQLLPATWLLLRGWDELVKGSELAGAWAVSYNDTAAFASQSSLADPLCSDVEEDGGEGVWGPWAWPGGSGAPLGDWWTVLDPTAPEAELAKRLAELMLGCRAGDLQGSWAPSAPATACREAPPFPSAPNGGVLSVSKLMTGGPGLGLQVTFRGGLRLRGNIGLLRVPSSTAADASFAALCSAAGLNCSSGGTNATLVFGAQPVMDWALVGSSEALVEGEELAGWWGLQVPYAVPQGFGSSGWAIWEGLEGSGSGGGVLGPLPYCISAPALAAVVQAAEDTYGLGLGNVAVKRQRLYLDGASALSGWARSYTWTLSFPALPAPFPLALAPQPGTMPPLSTLTSSAPLLSVAHVTAPGAAPTTAVPSLLHARAPSSQRRHAGVGTTAGQA